jgi:hypothetical protein
MLKILTTGPADNGNSFLCLECKYMNRRSGRMNELDLVCSNHKKGFNGRIGFRVTQCCGYFPAELARPRDVQQMLGRAHYVQLSSDTGRMELFPPEKANEYGLFNEVRRSLQAKFQQDFDDD